MPPDNFLAKLLLDYLLLINLITGGLFAWDKFLAKQPGTRRISERNLLLAAFLGGTPGGILAMYVFRHKTRHLKFRLGLPLLLLLQVGLSIFIRLY